VRDPRAVPLLLAGGVLVVVVRGLDESTVRSALT